MNYKSWPRQHVLPTFKPALNKLTNLHLSQNPDIIKTEFIHSEATFVLHINNCKSDWKPDLFHYITRFKTTIQTSLKS